MMDQKNTMGSTMGWFLRDASRAKIYNTLKIHGENMYSVLQNIVHWPLANLWQGWVRLDQYRRYISV